MNGRAGAPATEPATRAELSTERPGEDVWRLRDRRDFLVRSLHDAEIEHDAGDLDDADYAALRRRDEADLGAVEEQLEALGDRPSPDESAATAPGTGTATATAPELDPAPADADQAAPGTSGPPRHRRRWMVIVGLAALVAAIVVLVVELAAPRLPGQGPTGSVELNPAQQVTEELSQAAILVQKGQDVEALQLYQKVLTQSPGQPEAQAEWGWLTWQAGAAARDKRLEAQGQQAVAKAVAAAPDFGAAHLYFGTILLEGDGQAAQAVDQYRLFLSEQPSASSLRSAAPFIRRAFQQAGQPLPPGVPAS